MDLGRRIGAVAAAILVLRRIPVVLIFWRAMRPKISSWREALFAGWFGPMGVSTFFYAVLVLDMTNASIVWPIVTAIIASSVVVHGLSASPLTKAFGHWEEDEGGIDPKPPSTNQRKELVRKLRSTSVRLTTFATGPGVRDLVQTMRHSSRTWPVE